MREADGLFGSLHEGEVGQAKTVGPHYLSKQMYEYVYGDPCVQLMGRDGTIGCGSEFEG